MDRSKILGVASLIVLLSIAAYIAFHDSPTPVPPQVTSAPAASLPETPAADAPQVAGVPAAQALHRYNMTVTCGADWTRIELLDGTFVSDVRAGYNPVEVTSDAPGTILEFLYSPNEIHIAQKSNAKTRIVLKGVIEAAHPTVHLRIGHGDNGAITVNSDVESVTNSQVLGDGKNYVVCPLRME